MRFKVYLGPTVTPGVVTLQADVETWMQVAYHLKANKLGGVAASIERQIGRNVVDRTQVMRLNFPDAQGRSILRACGLSA